MDDLTQKLNERFGIAAFRPWQREAVDALLFGSGSVLAIAPTGGGKSLCYQFPATELQGISIVVSPLIALMDDQVRSLSARGIGATYLASTLDVEERRRREQMIQRREIKVVYVAPERLANPFVLNMMADLAPELVAIDEAHCISQWGHDFRPEYLKLGEVLKTLAPKRVIACTATATPLVRDEIRERLGLADNTVIILRGFARPNLHLTALELNSGAERKQELEAAVETALGSPGSPLGCAIVYCATRKTSEEWAQSLASLKFRVGVYHAGMSPDARAQVGQKFATRELDIVCATNAFGMGIDRSDVRLVVHTAPPGSIEAYYQEVGRAGRDGQPAKGLLLSVPADIALRKRLIEMPSHDGSPVDTVYAQRLWKMFLELMRYVEAGSCRHDFILRYFADEHEVLGGCGHCDVCESLEEKGAQGKVDQEDLVVVRQALAGVARAKQQAGLGAVAEMLVGDANEKVRRWRFHELSTFGLLKEHNVKWVTVLLRRLLTAGLIDLTIGDYPLPYLTEQGRDVMTGKEPVRVLLPAANAGQKRPRRRIQALQEARSESRNAVTLDGESQRIFEELRACRSTLAKGAGVPPYVICHDRTLIELAQRRPKNRSELGAVHGMGPLRIENYGEQFLAVLDAR